MALLSIFFQCGQTPVLRFESHQSCTLFIAQILSRLRILLLSFKTPWGWENVFSLYFSYEEWKLTSTEHVLCVRFREYIYETYTILSCPCPPNG